MHIFQRLNGDLGERSPAGPALIKSAMDDFDNDHDSNASSDEQDNQDDHMTMEDADGDDMEAEEDDAFNEDDDDQEQEDADQDADADADADAEADADADAEADAEADADADVDADQEDADHEQEGDQEDQEQEDTTTKVDGPSKATSIASPLGSIQLRPKVRPEAITARLYDIVPTMAAPQATSINALAVTPDLRYWITGGSDGYIRKYDGPGTINGKQLLTVAQRHPFVDSVTKSGILMSYWENLEPAPPNSRGAASDTDRVLSPVYSLAVHSEALWLLAGLESGGINLHSVRHDEGKTIHVLQGHKNAVSVLQLAPDEKSVLSGSWDKNILDWDLNTGKTIRDFKGIGGQISVIEPRPLSGAPIPPEAAEDPFPSDTMRTSSGRTNGFFSSGPDTGPVNGVATVGDGTGDAEGSDHESLFGSPAGSLFGEGGNNMGDGGEGNPFGADMDNDHDTFTQAMLGRLDDAAHADSGHGDISMGDGDAVMADAPQPATDTTAASAAPAQPQAEPPSSSDQAHVEQQPPSLNPPQQPAPDAERRPSTAQGETAAQATTTDPPQLQSPSLVFNSTHPPTQLDPTQMSDSTFLSASIDGTIRLWDRRAPLPQARIGTRPGVPPWCMGACWSPDGNTIYAGRRNGTVEEFSIHKATSSWAPERTLKFPQGSGAVSAVRPMPNGRHLVCASYDILRLYDLKDNRAFKHGAVPFLIIPGPPRAGVISQLYIDPTARFMITAAGTRGWDGSSTEVLIGYDIGCVND
ncbi:Transcription factor spt8 [Cytospora paraplurivora]|uniref:Transcription factor spt8 n=1 Tax=Cytospora paraplurivora TaxID=2898453 RepID=A0AAN9YD75_9PEZI